MGVVDAQKSWVWFAVVASMRVTAATPPFWPRCQVVPAPVPARTGTRPRRSGRAKVLLAVAAVGGADQDEEGVVLADQLLVAPLQKGPAGGGEVATEHADLADEGVAHRGLLVPARVGALDGLAQKFRTRYRCRFSWACAAAVVLQGADVGNPTVHAAVV